MQALRGLAPGILGPPCAQSRRGIRASLPGRLRAQLALPRLPQAPLLLSRLMALLLGLPLQPRFLPTLRHRTVRKTIPWRALLLPLRCNPELWRASLPSRYPPTGAFCPARAKSPVCRREPCFHNFCFPAQEVRGFQLAGPALIAEVVRWCYHSVAQWGSSEGLFLSCIDATAGQSPLKEMCVT